jgi:hypothetical protein
MEEAHEPGSDFNREPLEKLMPSLTTLVLPLVA